jgi:hypothetical protein
MVITSRKFFAALVFATALFATGCTHVYTVPDVSLKSQGSDYIVDKKIDLAVNLCLSEELRAAKSENHALGDTFIIPIGEPLTKNTSELAEILFRDVVTTNAPVPAGTKKVDAILTPRVAAIERSMGAHAFGESILTVVLEWKLEDTRNNMIWIDSIKGEGRANTGNVFTANSNAKKQAEMLLKDLFGKSFQAMKTSPEISQFVIRTRLSAQQSGIAK